MKTASPHVVYKKQYFGYIIRPSAMVVMSVDVEKGGDPTLINNTIAVSKRHIRQAKPADYKHFRIRWPGMN